MFVVFCFPFYCRWFIDLPQQIIHLRDIEVDICIILVLLMRVDEAIINVQPKYNLSSTLRNWWNTVSVLSFIPSIKLAKFRLLIDRIAIYLKVGLFVFLIDRIFVVFHKSLVSLWKQTVPPSLRSFPIFLVLFRAWQNKSIRDPKLSTCNVE
jgi:hypothetical protein